jgi:hypothetical protein
MEQSQQLAVDAGRKNVRVNPKNQGCKELIIAGPVIINGKRTTKTITPEVANECRKRIRNYRKVKKQFDNIPRLALQEAPWIAD